MDVPGALLSFFSSGFPPNKPPVGATSMRQSRIEATVQWYSPAGAAVAGLEK